MKKNLLKLPVNPVFLFLVFCQIFNTNQTLAQGLEDGFEDQLVLSGLSIPTAMEVLPDGRLIILEKQGNILLTNPNVANPTSSIIYTLDNVEAEFERGLLTLAVDPDFSTNNHFYIYYTTNDYRLRLSRLTLTENVASNEVIIWESQEPFDPVQSPYHFGGALAVTNTGKIFFATGDMMFPAKTQDLQFNHGKLLRLNIDGSIPADNPIANSPYYAWGLRNPFKGFYDEQTSTFMMGVVGGNDHSNSWEDIHYAKKGANYGWPNCGDTGRNTDGSCIDATYTDPIYSFQHRPNRGNSIIGGFVYRNGNFPAAYQGSLFMADYAQSWIRYLTLDDELMPNGTGVGEDKAINLKRPTGGKGIVDIKQGKNGEIFYLDLITGVVRKIFFKNGTLLNIISSTADKNIGEPPLNVQVNGEVNYTGNGTLTYTWFFGDGEQSNSLAADHTYNLPGTYKARLNVEASTGESVTSEEILITVGSPPEVQIIEPIDGYEFIAGERIEFSGVASDINGLTDENYNWNILFKHNDHTHPGGITGYAGTSGTLNIPTTGHSFHDETGFIINLEVTNQNGITTSKSVTIFPKKVNITYNSIPSGLTVYVDGQPRTTPFIIDELQLFESEISVVSPQILNGKRYFYESWSNGKSKTQVFKYPTTDQELTVNFKAEDEPDNGKPIEPIVKIHEIEDIFQKSTDVGNFDIRGFGAVSASNGRAVSMYDRGDKIAVPFSTGEIFPVDYEVRVRLRSGDVVTTDGYFTDGYKFEINNSLVEFKGDPASISDFTNNIGGAYWGEMFSGRQTSTQSEHILEIEALKSWAAVDMIQVTVYSGQEETEDLLPTVDAGEDIILKLPTNAVVLTATGTDPDGGEVSFSWSQNSGPSQIIDNVFFGKDYALTDLVEGIYEFELTVTDDEGNLANDKITVTVEAADIPQNELPTVDITSPLNNFKIEAEIPITITATADDNDGNIQNVSFFANGELVGEDMEEPFDINWIPDGTGVFQITASARDNDGGETISGLVSITVLPKEQDGELIIITNKYEAEDWFEIVSEEGANDVKVLGAGSASNGAFVSLFDKNDILSIPFTTGEIVPVKFDIRVRLRSGNVNTNSNYFSGGYDFKLNGEALTFTPDIESISDFTRNIGGAYWGSMESEELIADQSMHLLEIEALKSWAAIDYIEITVYTDPNPPVDELPLVSAGENRSLTLPDNSITLAGTGSDPDGGTVSFEWSQLEGPSVATLDDKNSSDLLVSNLIEGEYIFDLTVTDDENNTANAQVSIFVEGVILPPNELPIVSITAPSDNTSLEAGEELQVTASASDTDGSIVKVSFYINDKLIGEATETPYSIEWEAKTEGSRLLEVIATDNDGGESNTASRTISVVPKIIDPVDELPLVSAGDDIILTFPDTSTFIVGTGSDPDGGTVNFEWSQLSGDNGIRLVDTDSSTVQVRGLTIGSYTFQLKVTDDEVNMSFDTVAVNVFEKNPLVSVNGELKKWHKVTLEIVGPQTSETAILNPFLDYKLDVLFTNGQKEYLVPGYFAADGNAAETSASSGNKWFVHFSPDEIGTWQYEIIFKIGNNIAVSTATDTNAPVAEVDGITGIFEIAPTDKTGKDHRAKGRLQYIGEHYLQYAETGEYFIKGGADSPENFLAYQDFDNTPNNSAFLKSWSAHEKDWKPGDPVWQGGKGKGIIGALNYLSGKGMNAFSFLTMNINGDDKNVFPYLTSNGDPSPQEARTRFDCSKLAQWEKVFEHADKLGLFMHFKTQEIENNNLLDGGNLGIERKLYLRELIARFGHHLALNWNLGEENDQTDIQVIEMADYVRQVDPYDHHLVIHSLRTTQNYINRYTGLLGNNSALTGASMQITYDEVHSITKTWLENSRQSDKKWVIANDEQAPGVPPDNHIPTQERDLDYPQSDIRKNVLWGNLMAGGSGVEYYFGYQWPECSDLTCQDFNNYDNLWDETNYALTFFRENLPYWEMENFNELVGNSNDTNDKYCLAKPNEIYVIYFSNAFNTGNIDLSTINNSATLRWFNPRTGNFEGENKLPTLSKETSIGLPPSQANEDWVAVIEIDNPNKITIDWISPVNDTTIFENNNLTLTSLITNGSEGIEYVKYEYGGTTIGESSITPFEVKWEGINTGDYSVVAKVFSDTDSLLATSSNLNISVIPRVAPIVDAGQDQILTLPVNSTIFKGSGSDPDGGSVTFKWDLLNGSDQIVLGNTDTQDLLVSGLLSGEYTFNLAVTDDEGSISNDQVTLLVNEEPMIENIGPEITLLSPSTDLVLQKGESVPISAEAFDTDGSISSVDFFANDQLLKTDSILPYVFNWENTLPGIYNISAKAIDNEGAESTTDPVQVTIEETPEIIATDFVLVNADNDQDLFNITQGQRIILSDLPTNLLNIRFDTELSNIGSVVFKLNDQKIRTEGVAPYAAFGDRSGDYYNWIPNIGFYEFTAEGFSAGGGRGTLLFTETVNFEITNTATSNFRINKPANGTTIRAYEEIEIEVSLPEYNSSNHKEVSFYVNGKKIGDAKKYPYKITWGTFKTGNVILEARLENEGVEHKHAIQLKVFPVKNILPEIDWISNNHQIYPYTKDVNLELSAIDEDGRVQKVEFYDGTELLESFDEPPFSYTWKAPDPGNYKITAIAYDNDQGKTISSVLSFTVLNPDQQLQNLSNEDLVNEALSEQSINFNVEFYPNPVSDLLLLDIDYPKEVSLQLEIFDFNGKLIRSVNLIDTPQNTSALNVVNLKSGNYLLRLSIDGIVKTIKFRKK